MKSRHLANTVRAARMKLRRLCLRNFLSLSEHFARAGEVKPTPRSQVSQRGKHIVSTVDVDVHCGKAVGETFSDEALRREVITLVKVVPANDVINARVTLECGRMKD